MFLIAHGISVRTDLPVPEVIFWWAASIVLVVSFVALATLWPKPRLQDPGWRPALGGLGRVLASRPVEIVCGAIGIFLYALTIYAGFAGTQSTTANWTPIFIFVIFWLTPVLLSILFGDIFRAFNPWRAIGRGVAWTVRDDLADRAAGAARVSRMAGPLARRRRASSGSRRWSWSTSARDEPENLAIAALVYSAVHVHRDGAVRGRALDGPRRGVLASTSTCSRGSRCSRRGTGPLDSASPCRGCPASSRSRGPCPLLMVMIGTVSFDGFTNKRTWNSRSPDIAAVLPGPPQPVAEHALELAFLWECSDGAAHLGLLWLGILGARSVGGGFSARELAGAVRAHAGADRRAYVGAHYFTLLLYQGQAIAYLASDPLGDGSNIFGTAGWTCTTA